MSAELLHGRLRTAIRKYRLDASEVREAPEAATGARWPMARLILVAVAFLVFGGGNREPGDDEARLGLAASEGFAPFGQVFGGWDPSLSPGSVAASQCWAWLEGGQASTGAIRWPGILAAVAIGLLAANRAMKILGDRAGVLVGLCLMSGLAMVDRSAGLGVDTLTGLAVFGALDRISNRGSDWVAGLWAAMAVAFGGWPALAVVALPIVVIGRPGASLSLKLLTPPLAVFAGWSAWAVSTINPEVWAAAVALPLTQSASPFLAMNVLGLALPWSPLAMLAAWPSVRSGLDERSRNWIGGWCKVAAVAMLAGSFVPGLAIAAKVPALVALATLAALGLDRVMAGSSAGPRRTLLGLAVVMAVAWGTVAAAGGAYLAAAASYYRALAFVVMGLGIAAMVFAVNAAWSGVARGAFVAVFLVAVGLKVAHCGYFVPEMNYRLGQGPWGRAIGQYVPPKWPIYTFHAWRADLAFATEHPIRQLPDEHFLEQLPGNAPKFVLLLLSEYENWSPHAPKLLKVRSFEDEYGATRVLARTEGPLLKGGADARPAR